MHDAFFTLSLAASAGVLLVILAQRLKLPSIVLLLAGGVILGPEVLGLVKPTSLSHGLDTVVSLAVAVILFEGGLTLDFEGYRKSPVVIRRLLCIGALITWLGTSAAIYWLFHLELGLSIMAGSLVIVTGPTVVSPLLRRLNIPERLHHVLYWEGVLIDVVGVFIAVLCYEYLTPDPGHPLLGPIARFVLRILIGIGFGFAMGFLIVFVLKRSWVVSEYINIFVLACALLVFAVAHYFLTESGILAVVVTGLVVGIRCPAQLKSVKQFKLQLTELGIGVLFILLAAKLELKQFTDFKLLAYLGIIIFVLRPIVIWVATVKQKFTTREKLFLSWIAPRGIVAAAMASLFAIRLAEFGYPNAAYLETLTYAVIVTTVSLQGISAPWVAKLLGLHQKERRTWVLAGDTVLVDALSRGLRRGGVKVVELYSGETVTPNINLDDPKFSDAHAVLCTNTTMLQNVWTAVEYGKRIRENACYRWATFEPQDKADQKQLEPAGTAVWKNTVTAAAVAEGLSSGSHAIDLVEIGQYGQQGRFDQNLQPLFWIKDGRAKIIADPNKSGEPQGEFAVVLRSRILGLEDMVNHVEVFDDGIPSMENVLDRLIQSAKRIHPNLPFDELLAGIIERGRTMPIAVGSGIAIPHGYSEAISKSCCFVSTVPSGITDLITPDDKPVRLVFLLISPKGKASEHLKSLASISSLVREPQFIDLLVSQRIPGRIAALINERT